MLVLIIFLFQDSSEEVHVFLSGVSPALVDLELESKERKHANCKFVRVVFFRQISTIS